jgi:hypothetical protein
MAVSNQMEERGRRRKLLEVHHRERQCVSRFSLLSVSIPFHSLAIGVLDAWMAYVGNLLRS